MGVIIISEKSADKEKWGQLSNNGFRFFGDKRDGGDGDLVSILFTVTTVTAVTVLKSGRRNPLFFALNVRTRLVPKNVPAIKKFLEKTQKTKKPEDFSPGKKKNDAGFQADAASEI